VPAFEISYQDIITRTSVRRYADKKIDVSDLSDLMQLNDCLPGIFSENQYQLKIYDYDPQSTVGKAVGGFGRIFNPPYVCLPYITGKEYLLEDLGFRNEQFVLYLWSHGIGSCYIGCIHRQEKVRASLDLPVNAVFTSFIIFGFPHQNQSLHLYRKISQLVVQSKERLSFDELFIDDGWKSLMRNNQNFAKVMEAGRRSPSAQNIQPWRFATESNFINIFAKLRRIGRIYDFRQQYAAHDIGICMGNIGAAVKSLGVDLEWERIETKRDFSGIDDNLLPIGRLYINGIGLSE